MQRINWFPDPNITQTFGSYAPSIVKMDFPVVGGRNWLRATTLTVGDAYAQYSLQGDCIPPAGTYHVHCRASAQHANAYVNVYTRVDGNYANLLQNEITDDTTVDVDGTITVPDDCDEVIVRITAGKVIGAIGMLSEILIERADTYDTAAGGGASGLLHGRHDAARIGASAGRVMSDDADYKLACASESGHPTVDLEQSDRDRELGWDENLLLCFGRHAEPFRTYVRWKSYGRGVRRQIPRIRQYRRRHDQTARRHEGWHLGVQTGERLLEPVFPIEESPHSARLGDLHARRLAEAPVAGRDAVRRGYHATRLTLTGVMA